MEISQRTSDFLATLDSGGPPTTPHQPIKVLLADDHVRFRHGLREVLELEEDIVVVGEAGDGIEAEKQAMELKPDVVLMDVEMPERDGLRTTRVLAHRGRQPRVIILTMYKHSAFSHQAALAGASGYLVKSSTSDHLLEAIRTVAAGRILDPIRMISKQ